MIFTAGIHGRINRANEDGTLQIEISRGTFMTIEDVLQYLCRANGRWLPAKKQDAFRRRYHNYQLLQQNKFYTPCLK